MRLYVLAAAAAALTLAACQPAKAPEAAKAEAPAAAAAPAADGAEAFVRGIYASMAADGPAPLGEQALWSAAAWQAMQTYEAAAEEGYNSDPLCNCQDPAEIVVQDLSITPTGTASADAAVTITQWGAQTSMVLNLVREGGGWRIDNITREGDPDFRSEVARWTAEARSAG